MEESDKKRTAITVCSMNNTGSPRQGDFEAITESVIPSMTIADKHYNQKQNQY